MKILILKPSSLGDVIMALPVLRMLRRHFPESAIYWWVATHFREIFEDDPDLTGLYLFERNAPSWRATVGGFLQTARRMRAQRFDWVFDLQGLARSGLLAWLANGALTIGMDDPREGAAGFYDRVIRRPGPTAHFVDWYVSALRSVNVPLRWDFTWLPEKRQISARLRARWEWQGRRWIVLVPGARWESKLWPAEYYRELVRQLQPMAATARVAIVGSAGDAPVAEAICAAAPELCVNLAGRTSVGELIEWIRAASVVVAGDTGPLHIAAAVKTPVIGLFGPSDPRGSAPYHMPDSVLQRPLLPCIPCMRTTCSYAQPLECLRLITPRDVFVAIQQKLHRE